MEGVEKMETVLSRIEDKVDKLVELVEIVVESLEEAEEIQWEKDLDAAYPEGESCDTEGEEPIDEEPAV